MKKNILLTILPYWDPMIPPMGITSLKGFLQNHGYKVKTSDIIVENSSLNFYDNYMGTLRKIVPEGNQGNFNNIGHDVLQSHLMAWQNKKDDTKYLQTVKLIIYNHYYCDSTDVLVTELNNITDIFYKFLKEHFLKLLKEVNPDVLGVTAYKCTVPASLYILKLAKEAKPGIVTIMGGGTFNESHAADSPNFELLLEYSKDYLDHIFIGQGELLLLNFLEGKLPQQRVYTKKDIKNEILIFESQDIPDFSDLDLSKYPYMPATASASCIYSCSFCVAKKIAGEYRKKSPEQLISELNKLQQLKGHQLFFMTDSLINPVIDDFSDALINDSGSYYYDAYFKVDLASADIRNTMRWRKGGLYRVRLGTESGSQKILDVMDKRITIEQIKASLFALSYAGIKTTTYWVVGHPGETEEDFQLTLKLIEECKDYIYQSESNYFLYHFSNQAKEHEWAKHRMLLYPKWAEKMILFKYWTLDLYPQREIAFERLHKIENHCKKLGIPNPYSYNGHIEADLRWKKLHKYAVPPLMDFLKKEKYINENKSIPELSISEQDREINKEFCFN